MSTLQVGIVGCGPRGLEHGEALATVAGLELAGVADAAREPREQAGQRFGVPAFDSTSALIEAVEPEIVVVATPPAGRPELIGPVAGSPGVRAIVAEKPLALRLEEAERLVESCEQAEVLLAVSHQSRYARPFLRLKEAIDAGKLGQIEFLRGVGYGNLLDQGNHLVDSLRWLTGSKVVWAMSQAERDLDTISAYLPPGMEAWSDADHPAPMWMTHHLAFESGVRATMETGLLYQRSEPFLGDWLQRRVTVVGTDGLAECRVSGGFRLVSRRSRSYSRWGRAPSEPDAIDRIGEATAALHAEVRDAVLGEGSLRATGRDSLETLEVVLACLASAADGGLVSLPLPRDRDPVAELAASDIRVS